MNSVLTGSDGRSLLERSLPVVSVLREGWETSTQGWSCVFAGVLVRRTQDWWCPSDGKTPLERSLPVVSVLTGSDGRSLLERSLPVVSVLRVPPESSTQGSSCVFAGVVLRRTQDLGWSSDSKAPQVQSLPVVSVLTGSDGRSLLECSL